MRRSFTSFQQDLWQRNNFPWPPAGDLMANLAPGPSFDRRPPLEGAALQENKKKTCTDALTVITTLLLIFLAFTSCAAYKQGKTRRTIAVLYRSYFNNYFKEMQKGVLEEAKEADVKIFEYTNDETDEQNLLGMRTIPSLDRIDALIIVPEAENIAEERCFPLIREANRAGKPVIFMHSDINAEKMKKYGIDYACSVQCDRKRGGAIAAEYLARKMCGRGTILILNGYEAGTSANYRKEAFLAALASHQGITTISSPPAHWNRADAIVVAREQYRKNPRISAVFAMNDEMAIGASDAAKLEGRTKPLIVGFDGTREGLAAVKDGRMDATISQNPYDVGRRAVRYAMETLNGKGTPKDVCVGVELFTMTDVRQPFYHIK
jgi:ribose transport system substrate-binding protein